MPRLFLPCAGGAEALLADEVQRITAAAGQGPDGAAPVEAARGGVWVEGDERTAMRLNLESRLAQRVLWPLAEGPYRDEHDLYALARQVRWVEWITPQETLRVDWSAWRCPLQSPNFAALRIKDAVCDALREATGARPSVDTHAPHLPLALFLGPEHASLYADTSGQPLFKRGWRAEHTGGLKGEAPLKETLAAALLAAAGWHGRADDPPLLDPCCGAGTIAIEAAQMACGVAPGAQRRFAFERWDRWQDHGATWRALQRAARERVHAPHTAVFAGDVSFRMTDFATRNAERAGVGGVIAFKTADALQRPPPAERGVIVMNPPYGERVSAKGSHAVGERVSAKGSPAGGERASHPASHAGREAFDDGASAAAFFGALAAHWKRDYAGWTAWLLSPEMKLPGLMRLQASARVPMWNGPIECRLFRFDLVAGSHRRVAADASDASDLSAAA